jgi:hypothetical protein
MTRSDEPTDAEQRVISEIKAAHPEWTAKRDGTGRWVIRAGDDGLVGRHRDIRLAYEAAQGIRVL